MFASAFNTGRKTEQVRVLSHERLVKGPVAKLSKSALASVEAGLKHVLDML